MPPNYPKQIFYTTVEYVGLVAEERTHRRHPREYHTEIKESVLAPPGAEGGEIETGVSGGSGNGGGAQTGGSQGPPPNEGE